MLETSPPPRLAIPVRRRLLRGPGLPGWAAVLFEGTATRRVENVELRHASTHDLLLAVVRVEDARSLGAGDLRAATAGAYRRLLGAMSADRSLVRVWNYIPRILEPLEDAPHRYMVFNAGRHDAYERWYGSSGAFSTLLATASGIGHEGPDLVIHALASASPGIAIENPRQVPAYLYSRRYGPLPPCFARATLLRVAADEGPWLLVGGTSSVVGEHSAHRGELAAQVAETVLNLEALLSRAGGSTGLQARQPGQSGSGIGSARTPTLESFRHLRVYHPARVDQQAVASLVEHRFPGLESLEYLVADLCRPELLVEMEGLAHLGDDAGQHSP
jgi:hypothetical protein